MTRYIFREGSCVIPNKEPYMDYDTWTKVVKLISPGIRKIKFRDVACVFPILFSICLTLHICPTNYLQMIFYFPKWWAFLKYYRFKFRVNVTEVLKINSENRIKVMWDDTGTSAFYQEYDKFQSN